MSKVNWRTLLGWAPEHCEELRLSGFSFLREGKYDKALVFFKALVILDPDSAYDIQTLGALYLQMGDGDKALKALEQALALDPAHEPSLLNKVKALLMTGKKAEALTIADVLTKSADETIAGDASALVISYS